MTLDPKYEVPCLVAFNAERQKFHLPLVVADEWLTEDARYGVEGIRQHGTHSPGITSGNAMAAGGGRGTTCASYPVDQDAFDRAGDKYSKNPKTRWFGGKWVPYMGGKFSGVGLLEFPIDPIYYKDPEYPEWP